MPTYPTFFDWVAKKLLPIWATLTGLSLIVFSFFGENLYWQDTAFLIFQAVGLVLTGLGIKWWIHENGLPFRSQTPRVANTFTHIHASRADVEYWERDDGVIFAQHGGHQGAKLRVRHLFGGKVVLHSQF